MRVIHGVMQQQVASGNVVTDGLVGYWPTNEGAGTTVGDVVNGADATFVGSMQWSTGPNGVAGTAIEATADGSRAEVPHANVPVISTAISICCWWKPTADANWHSLVSKHVDGDVSPFTMYYLNSGSVMGAKCRLSININNLLAATIQQDVEKNVWHHIVATWASSSPIRCYSDDVLLDQTGNYSGLMQNYTSVLAFCGHGQITNRWARGPVAMIRLYNRAISTSEMAEIRNYESPPA